MLVTNEAIYDIADIEDYIVVSFSENTLEQFRDKLKETLMQLGMLAGTYGKTDLFYRNYSIYKWVLKPSLIFYIINEPRDEVHVLRILREETKWESNVVQNIEYHYNY